MQVYADTVPHHHELAGPCPLWRPGPASSRSPTATRCVLYKIFPVANASAGDEMDERFGDLTPGSGRSCPWRPSGWTTEKYRLTDLSLPLALRDQVSADNGCAQPAEEREGYMSEGDGERRPAGELEASVLAALWAAGKPQSAAEVRSAMPQPLARTTVATLLARLYDKGVVDRSPVSRGFVYFPVEDTHGLTARRMHRELDQDGDRNTVLARFIEGLTSEDEAELRRLLDEDGH
ncbi:BlaI/MecI/CopY family transcriptional regulator [Streptomyces sp. NPDC020951]|uniref:BlaI/MecI/CopY family transcriptional regulator n=1 Tax=Streptomyces sp. NPDC020951 TaxID=3365104 RepID=UPI00379505CB